MAWSHSGSIEEAQTASLPAKRQLTCNLEKSCMACLMLSKSKHMRAEARALNSSREEMAF